MSCFDIKSNDPQALKAWRFKSYGKNKPKSVWDVLLNPPKTKKRD